MDEDFSRQTRRFSAAILTDCKGNRRGMAGKRPARRRTAVVNTGSKPPDCTKGSVLHMNEKKFSPGAEESLRLSQ
ncbi:hypothetical protein, partial [uncultured Oscillibacter sp.]|uniref:hypothetical protein n=1 Tax=uncultured Oscillibacter sp. TaxID=876091 RepID=UPI00272B010F